MGFNNDSRLNSTENELNTVKWYLDQTKDLHSNVINYTYLQNPYVNDSGAVYLDEILSRAECTIVHYIYDRPRNGIPSEQIKHLAKPLSLGLITKSQFGYQCTDKVTE